MWHRLGAWATANLRRTRTESEMDAEMRFHVEAYAEDLVRGGMPQAEATRQARVQFGGIEQKKEECRDARGMSFVEGVIQDVRFGLRTLRKSPGFTITAVLTLALGIGATVGLFSVIEAVVLRPLPYPEARRLVVLWTDNVRQNLHEERTSYPNFEDWQKWNTTFDDMAFASGFTVNLTAGQEPERVVAGRTSANLFSVMGVKPVLGRTFSEEEELRGDRVVVASYGLWRRWLGSSPTLEGKSIEVDGTKLAVVGVMPATFQFPDKNIELWLPLSLFPNWNKLKEERGTPSGFVVGRLKRGVPLAQAKAEMNAVGADLARQYPELAANLDFFGFNINVVPFDIYVTGKEVRAALWILFGAVILVLFTACVNVASLLLARGTARAREIATRLAVGAGKRRVVRQLLTEITILYLTSGLLGIALAAAADHSLIRLAPVDIPRLGEANLDSGVIFFALGLSLLTAFLFGVFPALRISGTDPHSALTAAGRNVSESLAVMRLRSMLLAGEFIITVILLAGAGLLIRSLLNVQQVDPGFRSDHVLTARIVQSKLKSEGQWRSFYEECLDRIRTIPGVEGVGAIDNFFFASFPDERVVVEGHAGEASGGSLDQVTDDGISPGYFEALAVPLLRGRLFNATDEAGAPPTAIINRTMSRRFWPGEDPIGRRFKFAYQGAGDPWINIVGVVGDMHRDGVTRDPVSEIFLPLSQHPARGMDLVVRTSADPRSVAGAVRTTIWAVDNTAPIFNVTTLENALRDQVAPRRFQTALLSLFAALAVIVSAVGTYGLMHYSVAQRTREIGIRMALGAQRPKMVRLVLLEGGRIALVGILVGVGGATVFGRVLRSQLFDVSATDPMTFFSVALFLGLLALAACWIPAWRASKIEPMVALRYE